MAAAAKYPPDGERSAGGDLATHFGGDYFHNANRDTTLAIQIEHIHAATDAELHDGR